MTQAHLSTALVIKACKKCIKAIEDDRKEHAQKVIEKYTQMKIPSIAALFGGGRFYTEQDIRDDQSIPGPGSELRRAENLRYEEQYECVKKILKLAEATFDIEMIVTSEDFHRFSAWYDLQDRNKVAIEVKSN